MSNNDTVTQLENDVSKYLLMGEFIVRKQMRELGLTKENLSEDNFCILIDRLTEICSKILGMEQAKLFRMTLVKKYISTTTSNAILKKV